MTIRPLASVLALLLLVSNSVLNAQGTPQRLLLDEILSDVEWSPDGQFLAVAAAEGIRVFTADLEQVAYLLGDNGRFGTLGWNPDGTQLVGIRGSDSAIIYVWDFDVMTMQFTLVQTVSARATYDFGSGAFWSPDGSRLAIIRYEIVARAYVGGVIQVWNTRHWTLETTLRHDYQQPISAIAWSPDGSRLASGGVNYCEDALNPARCPPGGAIVYVADATSGERVWADSALEEVSSVAWSDSNLLAAADFWTITIYDGTSYQELAQIETTDTSLKLAWVPNHDVLTIASYDGRIDFYDVSAGDMVTGFQSDADRPNGIAWSSTGKLAVIGRDGELEVWTVDT